MRYTLTYAHARIHTYTNAHAYAHAHVHTNALTRTHPHTFISNQEMVFVAFRHHPHDDAIADRSVYQSFPLDAATQRLAHIRGFLVDGDVHCADIRLS